MEIRRLLAADAELYQSLRLRALAEAPRAFLSSHAEESAYDLAFVAARLEGAGDDFVLGAFADGALVGLVGFHREPRLKARHRGLLWGMYVAPEQRGRGVARELIAALLERARALGGLAYVDLAVDEDNAPARGLYAAIGFEVWAREPDAFRIGDDSVIELHMRLHV
jgi:ribosomal protein S18 acetylase RimI-like enzyme